ncbi:MAG TPA: four helix bundle protein [Verrucomicrobiae bacterium]|nr:four helix bundle protein [Verrucomicrobiae bacterium]
MMSQSRSKEELEKSAPTVCDLRVWEQAFELALGVFRIAEKIPLENCPGLSAELRVVALSIPSYIARGHSRATTREFLRGLYQARGALLVLRARLYLCGQLDLATPLELRRLDARRSEVSRLIETHVAELRGSREVAGLPTATTAPADARAIAREWAVFEDH